jgi:hypothetical protein
MRRALFWGFFGYRRAFRVCFMTSTAESGSLSRPRISPRLFCRRHPASARPQGWPDRYALGFPRRRWGVVRRPRNRPRSQDPESGRQFRCAATTYNSCIPPDVRFHEIMICGAKIPKDVWMPESFFRSLFTPVVPGKSTKKHLRVDVVITKRELKEARRWWAVTDFFWASNEGQAVQRQPFPNARNRRASLTHLLRSDWDLRAMYGIGPTVDRRGDCRISACPAHRGRFPDTAPVVT